MGLYRGSIGENNLGFMGFILFWGFWGLYYWVTMVYYCLFLVLLLALWFIIEFMVHYCFLWFVVGSISAYKHLGRTSWSDMLGEPFPGTFPGTFARSLQDIHKGVNIFKIRGSIKPLIIGLKWLINTLELLLVLFSVN